MANPLSSIVADVYLDKLENTMMQPNNNIHISHIFQWYRYVDDFFCIWTGSTDELKDFLKLLNSYYLKLQFTCELG